MEKMLLPDLDVIGRIEHRKNSLDISDKQNDRIKFIVKDEDTDDKNKTE